MPLDAVDARERRRSLEDKGETMQYLNRSRWSALWGACFLFVWTGCEADAPTGPVFDASTDGQAGDSGPDVDAGGCASGQLCGPLKVCCRQGDTCQEFNGEFLCLPECESQKWCGVDLRDCCGEQEMCWGYECVVAGPQCSMPDECAPDEICDPALGRCMPKIGDCEAQPVPGEFAPVVEWHWDGLATNSAIRNVMMTPAVADMDGDGVPEVVFVAFSSSYDAALVVVSGATGQQSAAVENGGPSISAHVAVGNLDADAALEVVVGRYDPPGVTAFEFTGAALALEWEADTGSLGSDSFAAMGPSLADLDGDGQAEVICGFVVIDGATGTVLADGGGGAGHDPYRDWLTAVADLDEDGQPEIVSGNRAVTYTGSGLVDLWHNSAVVDGNMAVGALYTPGTASVVTVAECAVSVLDGPTGNVLLPAVSLPGQNTNCQGGPPTVADFDGDTFAEIGVAGRSAYTVFDLECVGPNQPTGCQDQYIRWSVATQDESSSITGSSVFDFEGDGRAEVVYNDECYLRVFDGATGAVRLEVANSSRTAGEYPVIADVDSDGNAEILVVANSYMHTSGDTQCDYPAGTEPRAGVYLYGDSTDRWVGTRSIWNQHTYHVTNVEEDGTLPAVEPRHWDQPQLNVFRQNIQPSTQFDAPDLVLAALEMGASACPQEIALVVRLANAGAVSVEAGLSVAFYRGEGAQKELIGTVATAEPLLPGEIRILAYPYAIPEPDQGEILTYTVVVDDDGTGQGANTECDEENNTMVADFLCSTVD
jgi:hypothetical protein